MSFDVQNIIDGQGINIAITGMVIVFFALSIISIFIAALPKILKWVAVYWPETDEHAVIGSALPATTRVVSDELVVAIAMTLHRRRAQGQG